MDFLDPNKKRSRSIRLAVGHGLMFAVVAIGTFLLVLQAYGFDVNRNTGEVIQNGLVFMDSAPDDAEIKLNGSVQQQRTNTRLALPEGDYSAEINKPQYRTWKKDFELKGGSIERFTYPTLFLNDLTSNDVQSFGAPVSMYTQSPDRRWALIAQQNNFQSFIEYDLNTVENNTPASQNIAVPAGIFTEAKGNHTLKVVEWSTNNKEVLLLHRWSAGSEYVVFNRDQPTASFNVNRQLDVEPSNTIKLFDKKTEKFYIYQPKTKTLSTIDAKTQQKSPIASNVINYEPYGEDILLLAVINQSDKAKTKIVIREGNTTYEIREIKTPKKLELALARYDDAWYASFNDPDQLKTYIYKNPVSFLKSQPTSKPVPLMVLKNPAVLDELNFSQNTQFIMARSGQTFSVYDNEYDRTYRYKIDEKFDKGSEVLWMDGHRIITSSGGKVFLFEFDGANKQTLVPANPLLPAAFNRDYTVLYTIGSSPSTKKPTLMSTQLRLEEDK